MKRTAKAMTIMLGFSLLLLICVMVPSSAYAGKVELTTYYPAPSGEYASLSASTSFVPPRIAAANRPTATSTPPAVQGMVIFNTTANQLEVYDGTGWTSAGGSAPSGAVMAFNLSACPSGWSAADGTSGTPDLRGVFVRGLDSGSGVDPSRILNSFQDYATASPMRNTAPTTNVSTIGYSTPHSYGFVRRTNSGESRTSDNVDSTHAGIQPDVVSWSTGDSETRPKNVALLYCVKN